MKVAIPARLNDGQIFKMTQRLKAANIPFNKMHVEYRDKWHYAMFEANSWAAKKAMHPFEGCNPEFTLWDTKVRGTAFIAFKIR